MIVSETSSMYEPCYQALCEERNDLVSAVCACAGVSTIFFCKIVMFM